jgi:integrase
VDSDKKLLTVKPRKTARYDRVVTIPIVPELEAVLGKAEGWKDGSGYVCPNVADRYTRNSNGVKQDYEWLLRKAGLKTSLERKGMRAVPLKTFHSLRHTFISRLAEKGVSPLVIQSMTGHTTNAMTERYSHIGLDAKRRALGVVKQ